MGEAQVVVIVLVVLVLRSGNNSNSSTTSSTATWGPYHWRGGPLTRNTGTYMEWFVNLKSFWIFEVFFSHGYSVMCDGFTKLNCVFKMYPFANQHWQFGCNT